MEKPIKASRMPDWSCGLPEELLASILQRLSLEDCIRVGAVCVAWRSLVAERGGYPPSKLPWLLLPRTKADEINGTCNFYSFSDKKEYKIRLPGVRWNRCLGSSDGWLIIILDERFEMSLLNPLTRSQIRLPSLMVTWPLPLKIIADCYVQEFLESIAVAVSWRSVSSYTVVSVISGSSEVAFIRAGDEAWTILHEEGYGFYELVHHKGLFYIQDDSGRVYALDLTGPSHKFIPVGEDLRDLDEIACGSLQLVQSSGDLFQLIRKSIMLPTRVYKTIGFILFKLDPSGLKWIKTNTLGNQALFLGCEPFISMSLSAHDFPGLEGSCIYFVDDYLEYGTDAQKAIRDLWVFNFEDESIKAYYPHDSHLACPIHIPFMPNLS